MSKSARHRKQLAQRPPAGMSLDISRKRQKANVVGSQREKECFRDETSRSQIMQTFVGNDKEFAFNLRSMKSHKSFKQETDMI